VDANLQLLLPIQDLANLDGNKCTDADPDIGLAQSRKAGERCKMLVQLR